jgi:hypothetical protein
MGPTGPTTEACDAGHSEGPCSSFMRAVPPRRIRLPRILELAFEAPQFHFPSLADSAIIGLEKRRAWPMSVARLSDASPCFPTAKLSV